MAQARPDDVFVRGFETTRIAEAARGRRHRRVSVRLPIRIRFGASAEQKGVMTDLSVRGCAVRCEPGALIGDSAELWVPDLGMLRGRVARLTIDGVGIALAGNRAGRQSRADALMLFLNRADKASRAVRYPYAQQSVLETMSGQVAHCVILDLSGTGASVATALFPALGEKVRIGQKRGTVTRHHEDGIGVSFAGTARSA